MDQFERYIQFQKEVAEHKLKLIKQLQKGGQSKPHKRTSKIDIAHNVLDDAGKPLHITEVVQLAKKDYGVELDRDSIVSAILKKVKVGKIFIRTAPNTFALKTYCSRQRRLP